MENKTYENMTFDEIINDAENFLKSIKKELRNFGRQYKKLNYENAFIIYDRKPTQYNILNACEDGNEAQLIVQRKKYNKEDDNFKIIESIKNMTFNIAYIKQNVFYGYYDEQFYKCYNIQCRQYEEAKILNDKFCINKDDVKYDIVNIKNYNEVESFGNCINAFKKYKFNEEMYRGPYLEQAFENKIWIENDVKFTTDNMKYKLIYYDIETYDTEHIDEVPYVDKKTSHIGCICYFMDKTHYILLSRHYNYDLSKIKETLKNNDVIIKFFDNESLMCQHFINHINSISQLNFLIGFNSWLTTQNEYEIIGYDLPFILERSNYIYKKNLKRGVKMYNQNGGAQIMQVDIMKNTYFIDMSLLLFNDLMGDEKNKMENYKLDSYLKLNNIGMKLDHDYKDLQYRLMNGSLDIWDILAYCCYDCEWLSLLNKKRNLINKTFSIFNLLNLPINYIYQTTVNNIKCFVSRFYYNNGLLTRYNINDKDEEQHIKFEGAYTKQPDQKYLYKPLNTIISDFSWLYPNTIIQYNISPETIEYESNENNIEFLLDDKNWDKPIIYYRSDKRGIIPIICEQFFKLRKETKKNMKNHDKNWDEYKQFDCLQLALKLIINSIYGMMGQNMKNYLYNKYCAMSVTCGGRRNIKYLINYLENKNIDVIFVDTDWACYENRFKTYNEFKTFNDELNNNLKLNLGNNMEIEWDILHRSLFINKKKCHSEFKVPQSERAHEQYFNDLNNNCVDVDKYDFVLKGVSWSNMTDYIKKSFTILMKNILTDCNNLWSMKNKINKFIDIESNNLKNIIDNKEFENLKQYGENIKLAGAKNKMSKTLIQKYNLSSVSTIIFTLKWNLKNKADRIIPFEYINDNIINKVSIIDTMNNFIKPLKKYFDYVPNNEFFEKYNFTNDSEMIKIRTDSILKNGNVWKIYNEIFILDVEKTIKKNKNKSYNELIINWVNKLYFDIEYEDVNININDFIAFLNTEILIGFDEIINIHIATAWKPNKLSYHIICDILCWLDYNASIALLYNKKHHNICDIGVYALNKSLRLPLCPKISHKDKIIEHRPFKILWNWHFEDFIIWYTENINNELREPYIYNNNLIHQISNCEQSLNNFDFNKWMNILNSFLTDNNIKYAVKKIKYNFFHILTLEKFKCPICERTHENDNLWSNVYNEILTIGCYRNNDEKQNKKANIKLKLSNEIKKEEKDHANIFLRSYINNLIEYNKDHELNNFDWSTINTPSINVDFLNIEEKIIFIKSGLGTGKTTTLKREMWKLWENAIILVLSFRITFANDFANKFGYTSYQDVKGTINNDKYKKVVLQVDSLTRYIANNKIDFLICDEIESIISQLTDMNWKNRDVNLIIQQFFELINKWNKCIFMDGLLEQSTINFIKYMTNVNNNDIKIIKNVYKNKYDHNFNIHLLHHKNKSELGTIVNNILNDLNSNKKIVIFAQWNKFAHALHRILYDHDHKNTLFYTGRDAFFDPEEYKTMKQIKNDDFKENINELIKEKNIKCLIYTSWIWAGIWIIEAFDTLYHIHSVNTCDIIWTFQALHRVRILTNKTINSFLQLKKEYREITPNQLYEWLKINDNKFNNNLFETLLFFDARKNSLIMNYIELFITYIFNAGYKINYIENWHKLDEENKKIWFEYEQALKTTWIELIVVEQFKNKKYVKISVEDIEIYKKYDKDDNIILDGDYEIKFFIIKKCNLLKIDPLTYSDVDANIEKIKKIMNKSNENKKMKILKTDNIIEKFGTMEKYDEHINNKNIEIMNAEDQNNLIKNMPNIINEKKHIINYEKSQKILNVLPNDTEIIKNDFINKLAPILEEYKIKNNIQLIKSINDIIYVHNKKIKWFEKRDWNNIKQRYYIIEDLNL